MAADPDGVMSSAAVLKQARVALASGELDRAADVLADHVSRHRDADALKMLGEVRHRQGDLAGAGAAWFATSAKGPLVDEAVSAWREHHDDDFRAMWDSLPASARAEPLTPKLSALRAKAQHPAPVAGADSATASGAPTSAPGRPVGPPARRDGASARRDGAPARPGGAPEGPGRESRGRGGEAADPGGDDTGGAGGADGAGGLDAAKVIAWILAALFVVCAVVGLITILRWIVPGG